MKTAKYALAALGLITLLVPTAKADTFVYHVTFSFPTRNLNVIFDLPSFEEVVTTTTFIQATSTNGPVTEFELSGNSTACQNIFGVGGFSVTPGPCWIANVDSTEIGTGFSPSFSGPGTFKTATSSEFGETTVTITDVSTVPEPSSLALISLGLVVLLVMRKRIGHSRLSAV